MKVSDLAASQTLNTHFGIWRGNANGPDVEKETEKLHDGSFKCEVLTMNVGAYWKIYLFAVCNGWMDGLTTRIG